MGSNRKEFSKKDASTLLVKVHRRCCICHRFCGLKLELHHIDDPKNNDIDNAIPLCFECHAEVVLYNPKHPKGRKYTSEELKQHRDQWIKLCQTSAAFLASGSSRRASCWAQRTRRASCPRWKTASRPSSASARSQASDRRK